MARTQYRELFEAELAGWYTDPTLWPRTGRSCSTRAFNGPSTRSAVVRPRTRWVVVQTKGKHLKPQVLRPQGDWVPFVGSVPHGGEHVPEEIVRTLLVELDRNYSDWYTPSLYSFLPDLGIPSVVATTHRLVADANREPLAPLAAPWPRGVVATSSTRGEPMYEGTVEESDAAARVALAHSPYHQALDQILDESRSRFESVVLLDCHSFGVPLGVDVVLGDVHGATAASWLVDAIEEAFREQDFTVRRNRPFIGGWITKRFADDSSVHAVLIEVNQRVYLNREELDREDWSRPTFDPELVARGAARLRSVFTSVVDHVLTLGLPPRQVVLRKHGV